MRPTPPALLVASSLEDIAFTWSPGRPTTQSGEFTMATASGNPGPLRTVSMWIVLGTWFSPDQTAAAGSRWRPPMGFGARFTASHAPT